MTPTDEILRALPTGVLLLDASGRVVFCNDVGAHLLGQRPENLAGKRFFREVAPGTDVPEIEGAFEEAISLGRITEADQECTVNLGERSLDIRIRIRTLAAGPEARAVIVLDDNTRLKNTERSMSKALSEARDQAIRDALTGLFNRRYVEAVLPAELARAHRYDVSLALLIMDVDHFKSVNDRYGHPFGDRVLIRLANVMQRVRRVSDTCARIGGEEFCVVLPHTSAQAAERAADRLLRVVRALRFDEEPDLRITVSIGVTATLPSPRDDDLDQEVRALLARADEALYQAKRTGRDRTVTKE